VDWLRLEQLGGSCTMQVGGGVVTLGQPPLLPPPPGLGGTRPKEFPMHLTMPAPWLVVVIPEVAKHVNVEPTA
jgi:hypothetical protein